MIKRYHEAPLCIFKDVQKVTDGDYALVHLFESNPLYLSFFKKAVADGREVMLDNSIFELGTAFDSDKFANWVCALKPTWYIVPDCWKNGPETVRMFYKFISEHPKLPGKRVGVAQGNTIEEVAESYRKLEPYCDMIAFNFDFSTVFYDTFWDHSKHYVPLRVAMSIGRYMVISELARQGVINTSKPHHLLGCGVPQEVLWYNPKWSWIYSIDTCNPVTAGLENWKYDFVQGIDWKSNIKICNIVEDPLEKYAYELNVPVSEIMNKIMGNIQIMKGWCSCNGSCNE